MNLNTPKLALPGKETNKGDAGICACCRKPKATNSNGLMCHFSRSKRFFVCEGCVLEVVRKAQK